VFGVEKEGFNANAKNFKGIDIEFFFNFVQINIFSDFRIYAEAAK